MLAKQTDLFIVNWVREKVPFEFRELSEDLSSVTTSSIRNKHQNIFHQSPAASNTSNLLRPVTIPTKLTDLNENAKISSHPMIRACA